MKLIERGYQLAGFDFVERNFFSLLGFSSGTCAFVVCSLHLAYIGVNLKLQYSYHVKLFGNPDMVGNITNLIEMVVPLFCHLTLVAESFTKRRNEQKLGELTRKIQLKLRCNLHWKCANLPLLKFAFLFAINSSIYVVVPIMVWHSNGEFV